VVHFRLAELRTEVEALRALTWRAVEEYIAGKDVTRLASMAKLKCGRLDREVADACLQYWGGMGYTWDNPGLARLARRPPGVDRRRRRRGDAGHHLQARRHAAAGMSFRKILIANRGDPRSPAACVMRTARTLGYRTVAVYSDADAGAPHVATADEAVRIGPPPAAESYLNIAADPRCRAAQRRRRRPSRLRLPQRERGLRPGLHRCRAGVHRPAGVGHHRHGRQGRRQAAHDRCRRADGARLSRRGPG
jgi:hypothetical protein